MDVSQANAEQTTRDLATHEGIFSGISAGGAVASAIELSKQVNDAVIAIDDFLKPNLILIYFSFMCLRILRTYNCTHILM